MQQIIKSQILNIEKLNSSIDYLLKKSNIIQENKTIEIKQENSNNPFSYQNYILNHRFDNFIIKISNSKIYLKKFKRVIEYTNKLINSKKNIKKRKLIGKIDDIILAITKLSLYIIKNNINSKNHLLNEKFFITLIMLTYWKILPIKNFILIINIFLHSLVNKIISEDQVIDNMYSFIKNPLYFINDLFEALINIPKELINNDIHIKLIDDLITILDENLFISRFNLELNKLQIWFKLLNNKIINIEDKYSLIYPKIVSFLVKIYKYNFQNLYYFQNIYEKSAISFDYFMNSLDFLWALFKEEEKKRTNPEFQIKDGFYIYNNTPLTLNKIKFKLNAYSLIFSFKLIKIENDDENTILFNLENYEQKKNILKFIVDKKDHILKIIDGKNIEWNTEINIEYNKEYLICLSQEYKTFGKEINLFINNLNIKSIIENMEKLCNCYTNNKIEVPDFDQNMTLELGKKNFEGIFGEVIIINKLIKKENINHLYNLKENYADIICSINNKNDFTLKNKNYTKSNEDILFFYNLKYDCILKILTYHIHSLLKNKNIVIIKPYGELKYVKNNSSNNINNQLRIRLYSLNYSIVHFPYQYGIEYLIFQLHKIISMSENDDLLNFYLYKTLYFILEYIKMGSSLFLFPKKDNKYKIDKKYIIFVLSLTIILNTKQRELQLHEDIRDLFLDFGKIYLEKNANSNVQKINLSILLNEKIFKKSDITYYDKMFNEIDKIIFHKNNSAKETSFLCNELLYKILLLDDILESNEIKHKKFMKIIGYFIICKNTKIKKDIKNISKNFIKYFIQIKSPKKIYHYLKLIYLNIDYIQQYFSQNEEFKNYILSNYYKIINNNCKYSQYIQILCFLIKKILFKDQNIIFETASLTSNEFIKNPNYKFIKCIFIKNFNIDNKIKFSFIKSSLTFDENEMDKIINFAENKKVNFLSLFDFKKFIDKLNSIIYYYYFLYDLFLKTDNHHLEILLKKSIKLILDFLDTILNLEEFKKNRSFNNLSDDCIIQSKRNKSYKDNKDIVNSQKYEKQNLINDFISELFSSSGIKLLFILYFNIYNENELKDYEIIRKYISNTIDRIYNPFYLYLLLPNIKLSNNEEKSNSYKNEILNIIIKNIISKNVINYKKVNLNNTLVLNSVIVLIRIYHIINDKYLEITPEKNLIDFLKNIFNNHFLYSKILFNINLIDEDVTIRKKDNNQKNASNKKRKKESSSSIKEKEIKCSKFLSEIILEIIFNLIEIKNNSDLVSLLNDILKTNEKNSIFYKIDDYFLEKNHNKNILNYQNNMIDLLNSSNISTNYCYGINMNNILYTLYFFIFFLEKQHSLSSINEDEKEDEKEDENENEENDNNTEIKNITNKAIEILFKDCLDLFKTNSKKIKKIKNKVYNENNFRVYDSIYEHFSSKYKDNKFNFSEGKNIYSYFFIFLQSPKIENKKDMSKRSQSNFNVGSFFPRNKIRKETYIPSENKFKIINNAKKESIERREDSKDFSKFKRQRSSSQNIKLKNSKFKNIAEKEEISNKKEIKLPINQINEIVNKNRIEEEKMNNDNINYDNTTSVSVISTEFNNINYNKDTNNINNNDESSSSIDSETSMIDSLNYNSDYKCSKSIKNNEIIEEKESPIPKPKSNFYLNHRNSLSSINLQNNVLSPEKVLDYQLDENVKSDSKNIRQTTKFLPINLESNFNNDINIEIINEIEDEDESHKFLNDKLKEMEILNSHFRKLSENKEPKWIRLVFNPKREFFKIFGFTFKNYIFNNRRFIKLKKLFKIKFKNIEWEKSIPEEENYFLKYPSKLKNFTCSEYYKPFLKPMLNFFENDYFKKAHSYVNNEIIQNDIKEVDNFSRIKYEKLFLIIKDKKKKKFEPTESSDVKLKIKCENISNKGSIFGFIYFSNSLMVFIDKSNNDERLLNNLNEVRKLFYLFSSDETDRLKNREKYIIIYYSEINEIILRKYCFIEIGYEIFMKDGRSYFFNFFTLKNRKSFYNSLVDKINLVNIRLIKNEEQKDKGNSTSYYEHNHVEFPIIDEPKLDFEKNEYSLKYTKTEITNFQYLLLINKFSSRTYNDCNQYLIFPLLYMDIHKSKLRDLSKAICLNKDEYSNEENLYKYKANFQQMKYHFNIHYSTMAYVLYYLMRIIPFTYSLIKLQSGHFDVASRMFTSLDNLLYVFSVSDENRELIPELFYSYESFLNLNYNNFGSTNKKLVNHFNTSQNIGIIEFVIDLRKLLERLELSPWINNIFGSNQLSDDYKSFNKFPDYSYEQLNNFHKEKELLFSQTDEPDNKKKINDEIKDIRSRIQLLSLGLTPSQLFKSPHPIKEKNIKKQNNNISIMENNINVKKGKFSIRKKSNAHRININLIEFINKNSFKDLLFIINNNDNSKIIFIFEDIIKIFNFISENEKDSQCISINLDKNLNLIKIKPYKNILIELYNNIFLLCRLDNKTLLLFSETQKVYIEWPCIITAIEFKEHNEINNKIHINKIIMGDEEGNLSLLEIETEFNEKKKEFKIISLNTIHKRIKTFYSYIKGIIYDKRLNIIISFNSEGFISINNGDSFEVLNLIEIDNNPSILNIKLSKYDLLYIYSSKKINNIIQYNLYCYTLNGIKASNLTSEKKLSNFFENDYGISIVYKDGTINQYNCATLKEIDNNIDKEDLKAINNKGKVIFCMDYYNSQNIYIIFDKYSRIIKINKEI